MKLLIKVILTIFYYVSFVLLLICLFFALIASLKLWEIYDGNLFYVMIRPKEQPGHQKFATLPELDHDIGKNKMVLTTIFNVFRSRNIQY